jgi:hypothetical protein
MSSAIQFDCKLRDRTVEVEKVDATCILAAEFELVETALAQQAPQAFFGVGGFLAELTREVAGGGAAGAVFAVLR